MTTSDSRLGSILLSYIIEIGEARCSITEATLMAESDEAAREILAALLTLHEDLSFRETQLRELMRDNLALATPVLELGGSVLLIPLIGSLDTARSTQLVERAVEAVARRAATVLVIDITGVARVDAGVAQHLLKTVNAVKLLGARTILTGVSPANAQILVGLDIIGLDIANIQTERTLGAGLRAAFSG